MGTGNLHHRGCGRTRENGLLTTNYLLLATGYLLLTTYYLLLTKVVAKLVKTDVRVGAPHPRRASTRTREL